MKRIITCITIILLTVGCDEILNKQPLGELSESAAYESESDAQKAITAVYHELVNNGRLHRYGMFDIASDDARKGGEGPSDGGAMRAFAYYNITSAFGLSSREWRENYRGINKANRILENIPNMDIDQNLKSRIVAEAKWFRAYFYFYLVHLFGDVPLVTSSDVNTDEIARTPKDMVLEVMYQDLMDASADLPLNSQLSNDELGRVTKGAAQALLGKIYLYQGDFVNAESWFQRVIDSGEYDLAPDFGKIFHESGEFGPGNIFEINFTFNPQFRDVSNSGTIRRGSAGMYGWGFSNPTQDLVDEFEENDPRLPQTVFGNGDILPDGKIGDVGNSETGYSSMKPYLHEDEFPPTGSPRDSPKNEILIRYGHILLWYAEASNENGKTLQALEALNEVRKRARQGNPNILPPVTTTDQDELREKIWHEQRVELAMENQRWFELKRTGRLGNVLRGFAEKYNTLKGSNFTDGVHEHWPIPQEEIDLSQGKLEQNPGY